MAWEPQSSHQAMESFTSRAAKRCRLTGCSSKTEQVEGPGSVERELADGVKVQTGNMDTDDLWVQLKRQTEEMENRIRRLAGCDRQQSVTAEGPFFEKKELLII